MNTVRLQRWSGLWLHPRWATRRVVAGRSSPLHCHHTRHLNTRYLSTSITRHQSLSVDSSSSSHTLYRPLIAQSRPLDDSDAAEQEEDFDELEELDPTSLPSPQIEAALASPKLAALHARLSLPQQVPLETLARCLVDPSADPDPSFNNSSLSQLGTKILHFYTSEYLICRFPRIPMAVLEAAMEAYIGPSALSHLTTEWGVEHAAHPGGEVDPGLLQCLRFKPGTSNDKINPESARRNARFHAATQAQAAQKSTGTDLVEETAAELAPLPSSSAPPSNASNTVSNTVSTPEDPGIQPDEYGRLPTTLDGARSRMASALIGALHLHAGRAASKRFYKQHIQSRSLDISGLFNFTTPGRDLSRLCAREGFDAPVARLLSETGRLSRAPVFLVGVYSGDQKLGEGAGASLNEARTRAASAALRGWYLYSPVEFTVPSDADGGPGKYRRNWVDGGEVIV